MHVEVSLLSIISAGIAVGLGRDAVMFAFRKASGITITSCFVAGIGGCNDRSTITGDTECAHIPKQTDPCRYCNKMGLEEVK